MKLPWKTEELEKKQEEIEKLEKKISELEDERDSFRKRFEAEKERRSKLSRRKQDAEEELNRLKDRLEAENDQKPREEAEETEDDFKTAGFDSTLSLLEKIGTIESSERELVTVYAPGKVSNLGGLTSLKNSVRREKFEKLQGVEGFLAFVDEDLGGWIIETSPFFEQRFSLGESFEVKPILEFIRSEKYWVLVTAGETKVFREKRGEYEEVERIKSRVDRKHSQGGFSQGRFERKRKEQIEGHLKQVEEALEDYEREKLFVLGDERLCENVRGTYLGGFDPNRKKPEQFYKFQVKMI